MHSIEVSSTRSVHQLLRRTMKIGVDMVSQKILAYNSYRLVQIRVLYMELQVRKCTFSIRRLVVNRIYPMDQLEFSLLPYQRTIIIEAWLLIREQQVEVM